MFLALFLAIDCLTFVADRERLGKLSFPPVLHQTILVEKPRTFSLGSLVLWDCKLELSTKPLATGGGVVIRSVGDKHYLHDHLIVPPFSLTHCGDPRSSVSTSGGGIHDLWSLLSVICFRQENLTFMAVVRLVTSLPLYMIIGISRVYTHIQTVTGLGRGTDHRWTMALVTLLKVCAMCEGLGAY